MTKVRIFSFLLFLVAAALGVYLVFSIYTTIEEKERIARIEEKVKAQLVLIREAEIAYQAVNGDYTADWNKLVDFMKNGIFYITEKSETIITLDYGADSVVVNIDTLGTKPVKDSLFHSGKYPNLDLANLKYIPESNGKEFEIFAAEIEKGGVKVDVIEVRDTAPANPARKESNEARNRKPLRFGSRTDVTTGGNWE